MQFIDYPSPNFTERRCGLKPSLIVLHYTAGKSAAGSLRTLTDPDRADPVSSHYMIDEEGRIYKLVDESKRAWHAGTSYWNGITDVNSASIGIEICNSGKESYAPLQIAALKELCHDIQKRHGIPAENIIGHSDVAPDRKIDPGHLFPWKELARDGIGTMPEVKLRDKFRAVAAKRKPAKLRALFQQAGYGTERPALEQLLHAFQQRYQPEMFRSRKSIGRPTAATVAKLYAVARLNQQKQSA
jgi:N-acetylmuramoyl-L-alanine amidase